jgi:MFS family permease
MECERFVIKLHLYVTGYVTGYIVTYLSKAVNIFSKFAQTARNTGPFFRLPDADIINSSMHLQEKVAALFNLRSGEGQLITLVMLAAIFAFLADSFLVTAAYALFLTTFDTSAISFVYVGISIAGVLASFLYLQASRRFGLMTTVLSSRLIFALLLAAIWLFQGHSTTWLLAALPVLQGVYQSLANTSFWNINGRLFDLQQAKRLFGLIGASGTIGYLLGGLFAPLFIALWGTENLLGVSLAAMIMSLMPGRCCTDGTPSPATPSRLQPRRPNTSTRAQGRNGRCGKPRTSCKSSAVTSFLWSPTTSLKPFFTHRQKAFSPAKPVWPAFSPCLAPWSAFQVCWSKSWAPADF